MGQFGNRSEDPGKEDPGGEEVGGGDLLFPSASGCASGDGEFDWVGAGVGIGECEEEAVWESDGEGDWVESGPTSLPTPAWPAGQLRRIGGNADFGVGIAELEMGEPRSGKRKVEEKSAGEKVRRFAKCKSGKV